MADTYNSSGNIVTTNDTPTGGTNTNVWNETANNTSGPTSNADTNLGSYVKGEEGGKKTDPSPSPDPTPDPYGRIIRTDEIAHEEMVERKQEKEYNKDLSQIAANAINDMKDVTLDRVANIDTAEYEAMLKQLKASQEQQAINQIDYATNQGITELQRTEQDAQDAFQTQRAQIDTDERRALDNQALYSRARGDNGGIGVEQYNSIQNTAATNRLTVNKEQTKLATDTQRQVADLRAQGEYDKADKLLSITQNYLSQLMSLKQWADEANVSIDEFNIQVAQWEANYKVSLAQAKLSAGTTMYEIANEDLNTIITQLANSGQALMEAGITPTAEQIRAMQMLNENALEYLNGYYPHGVNPIT